MLWPETAQWNLRPWTDIIKIDSYKWIRIQAKYKFVNLTCKIIPVKVSEIFWLHNSHILDHFTTTKAKEEKKEEREEKWKGWEKKGRWCNKKLLTLSLSQNCSFFKYCKPEKLYSCILLCVTIVKKWSTVFKLYAKTCLYFFHFF